MAISFVGKGTPITAVDFADALALLGPDAAALWAIFAVETRGFGFLSDRRPQILFERHVFHARTKGRFSGRHPAISNPVKGGYIGGSGEYARLARAMTLDETAALESASWGLGQVMGFNASSVGFNNVESMVRAMVESEKAHLLASVRFILNRSSLLRAYRARAWEHVAFFYNGRDYRAQHYDQRLQHSYLLFNDPARLPSIGVRTAQACLTYLGFRPGGVDGQAGVHFQIALNAYRAARGLPPGLLDAPVLDRLTMETGI